MVILTDPASVKIALAPGDPHVQPLQARWHAKLGIVLRGQSVPAHPATAFCNCGMEQTKALAITEEPEGGSQAPTTPVRWVGTIS